MKQRNGVGEGRFFYWLTRKNGHESEDSSGLCALLLAVSQPLRYPSRASAYTTVAWTLPAPAVFVPSYTCQCVSKKTTAGVKEGFPKVSSQAMHATRGGKASTYKISLFPSLLHEQKRLFKQKRDYPKAYQFPVDMPISNGHLVPASLYILETSITKPSYQFGSGGSFVAGAFARAYQLLDPSRHGWVWVHGVIWTFVF